MLKHFAIVYCLLSTLSARIHWQESPNDTGVKLPFQPIPNHFFSGLYQKVVRPNLPTGRLARFLSTEEMPLKVVDIEESKEKYLSEPSQAKPVEIAFKYWKEKMPTLFTEGKELKLINEYKSKHNGVTHLYFKQLVNGIEVENGDANINIDQQGRILSFGESLYKGETPALVKKELDQSIIEQFKKIISAPEATQPSLMNPIEAVKQLARYLNQKIPSDALLKLIPSRSSTGLNQDAAKEAVVLGFDFTSNKNGIPVKQKYLQRVESGSVFLDIVWDVEAEMEENWIHAHISATDGQVLNIVDWVSDFSEQKVFQLENEGTKDAYYNVFPLGVNDPDDGERQLLKNPHMKNASPYGWTGHKTAKGVQYYTSTKGNNVFAQENWSGQTSGEAEDNYRPEAKDLKFDFPLDLKKDPKDNVDAIVTNLFYWNNIMHDLFYQYGFNEESGNFQDDNFGRGGHGGDAVIANAQDGSGTNNANFATPPDGKRPKMRMYVWTQTEPKRDGDLESGIIIHEYTHGISIRLTGGPMNSNCLSWGESGGLGEGYGDFISLVLRQRKEYTRNNTSFGMGNYAMGQDANGQGIRKFRYTTDMTVNPETYAFTKKFSYYGPHAKGEVWAGILFEVYWNLVEKHGFSENLFEPSQKNPGGNIIALQLLIDSMKFQPCRPSFVDARDAFLQADEVNYGGSNTCEIWKGFAKRGLGFKARSGGKESFDLPPQCE